MVIEAGTYNGRYLIDGDDPTRIGDRLRDVGREVLQHLADTPGLDLIEIVVEVRAEAAEGFPATVRRTVNENARTLGFDMNEFRDIEL